MQLGEPVLLYGAGHKSQTTEKCFKNTTENTFFRRIRKSVFFLSI